MLRGIYDFVKSVFAPLGDYLIGRAVPVGSSFAGDIDSLIALITVLVGFWALLAYAAFFFLIFRFREQKGQRAQYVTGEEKNLKRWITIPHAAIIVCDLLIVFMAIMVWYNIKQRLPEADSTVRIVAQQWAWNLVPPWTRQRARHGRRHQHLQRAARPGGHDLSLRAPLQGRPPRFLGSRVPLEAGRDPGPRHEGLVQAHQARRVRHPMR